MARATRAASALASPHHVGGLGGEIEADVSLVRLERVRAERERQLDPGRGAGRGQRGVVAADPALDQVEEATLVAIRGREVEGEARHRVAEAAVHVAVRHRCVAPLVDVDEIRLPPVVRHPVRERTARLSPKQATASFPAVLDVVLRGGDVVDGTGAPRRARRRRRPRRPRRRGRRGRRGRGAHDDVDGLVVAPGFVDIHTHYDAQVLWDPMCTPSPLHGVTTVIGGNCGFTIAPLGDAGDVDYVMRMMARVEGMPLDSLRGRDRPGTGGPSASGSTASTAGSA